MDENERVYNALEKADWVAGYSLGLSPRKVSLITGLVMVVILGLTYFITTL